MLNAQQIESSEREQRKLKYYNSVIQKSQKKKRKTDSQERKITEPAHAQEERKVIKERKDVIQENSATSNGNVQEDTLKALSEVSFVQELIEFYKSQSPNYASVLTRLQGASTSIIKKSQIYIPPLVIAGQQCQFKLLHDVVKAKGGHITLEENGWRLINNEFYIIL